MNINEHIEEFFDKVYYEAESDLDNCRECSHITKMTDPFMTGDSPTIWECTINDERECPYVLEAIEKIKKL